MSTKIKQYVMLTWNLLLDDGEATVTIPGGTTITLRRYYRFGNERYEFSFRTPDGQSGGYNFADGRPRQFMVDKVYEKLVHCLTAYAWRRVTTPKERSKTCKPTA